MTRREARAVLVAVAGWEPVGTSIALLDVDRARLREQVAFALAPALGLDEEAALVIVEATRMSSP